MKKSLNTILLLAVALLLYNCSDDSTGPSSNEKGHLSAKFNGEYWVPNTNIYFPSILASHYATIEHFSYLNGRYSVVTPRDSFDNTYRIQLFGISRTNNQEVRFYVDSVQGKGTYPISHFFEAEYNNLIYSNSNMKTGFVKITEINIDTLHYFNSIENIWSVEILSSSYIKGTFEIECDKDGSKLNITEGKFYLENEAYHNF